MAFYGQGLAADEHAIDMALQPVAGRFRPQCANGGPNVLAQKASMVFVDEANGGASVAEVVEVKAYKNNQGGCGCTAM